jgi:hypothetical protein
MENKAEFYARARVRKSQRQFVQLSALLWGALRRRAWRSAGEVLRLIGVFDQMPIDFMKGAVELTRRRFTPDRLCRFLRQVQTVQDRNARPNGSVQTQLHVW